MEKKELEQLTALVAQDFEPAQTGDILTEEQLLDMLSEQIAWMIEHRLEYLMSLMYRLDVDERKVDRALSPLSEEPAHIALAKLVLERQRQRVFTKGHYKQEDLGMWEW